MFDAMGKGTRSTDEGGRAGTSEVPSTRGGLARASGVTILLVDEKSSRGCIGVKDSHGKRKLIQGS
jgi:hypothetical protein